MACGTIGGARAKPACPGGDHDEHDENLKTRTHTRRTPEEK